MLLRPRSLVFLAAALLASASHAVTFEFSFDDVFASASGDLADFEGTYDITGSITVADDAMDLVPDPNEATFDAITSFVLEADGLKIFDLADATDLAVGVEENGANTLLYIEGDFGSSSIPQAQGLAFFDARIAMGFLFDGSLVDDNSLPLELPDSVGEIFELKAVVGETKGQEGGGLGLDDDGIPSNVEITGTLLAVSKGGSISVGPDENPIPEPTAAFLFAGGLLVTAHHLRRRR